MPGARARSGGRGAQIDATCGDPRPTTTASCSPGGSVNPRDDPDHDAGRLRTGYPGSFRYAVGSRTCHGSVRHAVPLYRCGLRWLWPSLACRLRHCPDVARDLVTGDGGSGNLHVRIRPYRRCRFSPTYPRTGLALNKSGGDSRGNDARPAGTQHRMRDVDFCRPDRPGRWHADGRPDLVRCTGKTPVGAVPVVLTTGSDLPRPLGALLVATARAGRCSTLICGRRRPARLPRQRRRRLSDRDERAAIAANGQVGGASDTAARITALTLASSRVRTDAGGTRPGTAEDLIADAASDIDTRCAGRGRSRGWRCSASARAPT